MAQDIAKTEAYVTSRHERKKIEMLFAHLKRILKLERLRLRGPNGARDEFHLAATAQNLRKLARPDSDARAKSGVSQSLSRTSPRDPQERRDPRRLFQGNPPKADLRTTALRLPHSTLERDPLG